MIHYTYGNHFHHVDMEWLWGYGVLGASLRDMLAFQERTGARGNLNFDGVGYERLAAEEPAALDELRGAVADGQIEIVGATYGQPYALFHGGESAVRQLVHGVAAATRLTGRRPVSFWEEEFCFFPQLPQLLDRCGFRYASLFFQWTWHTPEVPIETAPAIWWRGVDGTRILAAPRGPLNLHQWPEDFAALRDVPELTSSPTPIVQQWLELYPSPDWMCRSELLVDGVARLAELGEVVPGTLSEVLEAARPHAVEREYTMDDVFHGMSIGKNGDAHHRRSRRLESALLAAEAVATRAGALGRPYPRWAVYPTWELDEGWRQLLAFQHHDNDECEGLCGHVGVGDALRGQHLADGVLFSTLRHLARASTARAGEAVAFNPLGWPVTATVERPDGSAARVELAPFSVVPLSSAAPAPAAAVERAATSATLTAGELVVTIDATTAAVTAVALAGEPLPANLCGFGPLSAVVGGETLTASVTGVAVDGSAVTFALTLAGAAIDMTYRAGLDGLEVVVRSSAVATPDPWQRAALVLRVVDGPIDELVADTPYAMSPVRGDRVDRRKYPTGDWMTSPQVFETVQGHLTGLSFVDLAAGGRGLLCAHDGSQGFERRDDALWVTLTMNDPWDEEHFDASLDARFLLVPHRGLLPVERHRRAEQFRRPPIVTVADRHGAGRDLGAVVALDSTSATVESLHRLDGYLGTGLGSLVTDLAPQPWCVRVVEWNGEAHRAVLRIDEPVAAAWLVSPFGEIVGDLAVGEVDGGWVVPFDVRPHAIETIALDVTTARPAPRDLDAYRSTWATVHRVAGDDETDGRPGDEPATSGRSRPDGHHPTPARKETTMSDHHDDAVFGRVRKGSEPYPTGHRAPAGEQLGLGVVGLGEGVTALAAAARTTHVRAVVGCDVSADARQAAERAVPGLVTTESYDELLARSDVDIVGIYTPDPWHGANIVAAFRAGKDVVCTKPVVNSIADARAVLAAGAETGRRLMVGQSCRFFEPFRRQRAAVEAGRFGTVELAEAHYVHRMDWYYASRPWVASGTDWVYLGLSHPLDLVRWYLGPLATVSAVRGRSTLGRDHGLEGFDLYSVNVVATSGAIGRVMGHYGAHELASARNSIECLLYGTEGTSLAQYHDMRHRYTAPDGTEITEDSLYEYRYYYFNNEVHGMHYGEFANYLQYFADCLRSGQSNSPDLREGLETFCLMEAVRQSAESGGHPVDVAGMVADVLGP